MVVPFLLATLFLLRRLKIIFILLCGTQMATLQLANVSIPKYLNGYYTDSNTNLGCFLRRSPWLNRSWFAIPFRRPALTCEINHNSVLGVDYDFWLPFGIIGTFTILFYFVLLDAAFFFSVELFLRWRGALRFISLFLLLGFFFLLLFYGR